MTAFPQTAPAASGWSTITMPSGFNSMANAASILSTGTIDNSSDPARFDYLLLDIGLGSFTASAGAMIEAALVPSLNGSYPSIAGTTFPVGSLLMPVASCFIDAGASAKIAKIGFRVIAPAIYKVCIRNSAGAAFAASGNSVAWAGVLRETRAS